MNDSFALTALQEMYQLGQENSVFLDGKFAFLYFSTRIENFHFQKFENSVKAVLKQNTLLSCQIGTVCTRLKEPVFHIEIMQDMTNQQIAEKLCRPEPNPDKISIAVLQNSDNSAEIHFRFSNQIMDGISTGIFLKQLKQHYETEILPETADFEEYAESQKNTLEDRAFFESCYQSFSADEFEMPFAVSPQKIKSKYCIFQKRHLDRSIYQNLKAIAEKNQISVFMLLMSIFGNVTARFSGAEKFYLNIPCTVRPENAENTIGLYSNFLIVPFLSDRKKPIVQNALDNSEKFHEIAKHRNFSGDEAVKLVRRYDRNIDSVNMVFTAIPPQKEAFPMKDIRFCTNQTAIECDFVELDGEYYFTFSSPKGLFPEYILNSFADMMINGCIETSDSNGTCKTFPLSEKETTIIQQANIQNADFPKASLNELLASAFQKYAEKPLLIYQNQTYSYQQILQKAFALSQKLSGERTAILLPKGIHQIIALYAGLLFAGAYMPVDISLSPAEIQHCLHSAGIKQIITNQELSEKIKSISGMNIILTEDFPETEAICKQIPNHAPDSIRIIINTSGTTGKPKSIMLKEESIIKCFCNGVKTFDFKEGDKLLALTNFGHDMAIFDTLGVAFFGGCIVMPDEKEMKEPSAWIRLIETYQIAVWQSVPSFMEMLMLYQGNQKPLRSLRKILHGGEFLTPVLAGKIMERFPNAELFNIGGPTETTIWNISHKVTSDDIENNLIPYGFPMPETEYHILNSALEECPIGVQGIMYCTGSCLSAGYAGNPEETEKQFIKINGIIYYHTGDAGIRQPNGELLICGRKDFQVKIHGKRVELSGIERVLVRYPKISTVAVIYHQNKLFAFYTADSVIESNVVQAFLREYLPEYMIPKNYIKLNDIPLTANGKYDRKALTEMLPVQKSAESKANTIREQILAVIEQETDEEPDTDSNFFEIGGDSLSGVKISAKVSHLLGKEIGVFELLNAETIGEWLDMIL